MAKEKKTIEETVVAKVQKFESFRVLKPFVLDKKYNTNETVSICEETTKNYLLTNKFIK